MIWKTNTHLFTTTVCRHTGETCSALVRMGEKLTQAMQAAHPMTSDDFEIEGTSTLGHCPHGCSALFRASHDRIRIFCGVDEGADGDRLDRFADMLLGTDIMTLPSGWLARTPYALLEATPIEPPVHEATHSVYL